uniref:Uncharacterized protein n=1 Tax=Panagrolaimus sp. ES5 TaxID=591445 RepID=A0AC34GDC8_9BILA
MMILSPYNNKVFDALGSVKAVSKMVDEKQINGVGKVIIDHGYENSVMVTLAHRHFDLTDNEVMLETPYGDIRVATPVDIEQLSSFGAQPVLLACTKDNSWHPVGYGVDVISSPAWKDQEFLKDVAEYLTKNDLHDKLLLTTRNFQDYEKKKHGFQFLETNNGKHVLFI